MPKWDKLLFPLHLPTPCLLSPSLHTDSRSFSQAQTMHPRLTCMTVDVLFAIGHTRVSLFGQANNTAKTPKLMKTWRVSYTGTDAWPRSVRTTRAYCLSAYLFVCMFVRARVMVSAAPPKRDARMSGWASAIRPICRTIVLAPTSVCWQNEESNAIMASADSIFHHSPRRWNVLLPIRLYILIS